METARGRPSGMAATIKAIRTIKVSRSEVQRRFFVENSKVKG
jgi:hypothetical protein